MHSINPQFITDTAGKKLVVLSAQEYKYMLKELDAIRLYDEAKKSGEASLPIDEALTCSIQNVQRISNNALSNNG